MNNERIAKEQAAAFKPNQQMEEMIRLMATDRAAFDKLPASTRIAAGHYRTARANWQKYAAPVAGGQEGAR